jgi:hypothetical protein
MELNVAYVFVTQPLYFHQMFPLDAAKLFREKADVYLDMTAHVSDERHRRVLHELFEEYEARADGRVILRVCHAAYRRQMQSNDARRTPRIVGRAIPSNYAISDSLT